MPYYDQQPKKYGVSETYSVGGFRRFLSELADSFGSGSFGESDLTTGGLRDGLPYNKDPGEKSKWALGVAGALMAPGVIAEHYAKENADVIKRGMSRNATAEDVLAMTMMGLGGGYPGGLPKGATGAGLWRA